MGLSLKPERLIRYREKIDHIVRSLESIPAEPKGELEICGIFYKRHTSTLPLTWQPCFLEISANVEDDYRNIGSLEEIGALKPDFAQRMRKCNGLRNYLVHRYDRLDEKPAPESVDCVKKALYEFLDILKEYLR
ncbi:MAG: DUF86 domain-containing protein [Methanothrix sp.]|nr:HepT-like ribonuclease domain-containing protein [Methanothrix sp.]MCX8207849.1 DUF86 domain-containing protein [Methanothrix sp.]